jgi:hypothetical protein
MMDSVRRGVVSVRALSAAAALVIASACATGVAEDVRTETMPTAASNPLRGCYGPDGVRVPRPEVVELCNGEDDNCDGRIDEGFDVDGDHWVACSIGEKLADCDDADPAINPGAVETCNGKDDNCDGRIDEGYDDDHDGFPTCPSAKGPPDCDDSDRKIHPGAPERCNGKDDDCDGQIDELPAVLSGRLTDPIDKHWALSGSASLSSGWALLTPDAEYAAGALWWNASYVFDTFDVSSTISIAAKSDGADGLAFAWIAGADLAVGGAGAGYGVNGLPGYAIAVDTLSNTGEPVAPFLVVLDAKTNTHLHRQSIPSIRDGKTHELRVKLDKGKVSAWVDSINYVYEFPLPGYVPFAGHWGFTAGTGSLTCAHWVGRVTMTFPNGQGCVL